MFRMTVQWSARLGQGSQTTVQVQSQYLWSLSLLQVALVKIH